MTCVFAVKFASHVVEVLIHVHGLSLYEHPTTSLAIVEMGGNGWKE